MAMPPTSVQPAAGNGSPRRSHAPLIMAIVVIVAACAYLASGFFFVQPDERAVMRRWGRVMERSAMPGLHWAWPWPVGKVNRPRTTEVKRVTVGLDPETRAAIAAGDVVAQTQSTLSDVFTGDMNIVKATMVASYQITQAEAYVLNTENADWLVKLAVEAVMVEALGGYSIDDALTEGKTAIQNATRDQAQKLLEAYGSGITLVEVHLEGIEPPNAIADAFRDVASAKKDREKTIDLAKSQASSTVTKAGGYAAELRSQAASYRVRRVQEAEGAADRFGSIYAEYRKAPLVTRSRLLLSTLTKVISRAKTFVVAPNDPNGPPLRITIGEPTPGR
jgi:membrane protease subunit HflK